MSRNEIKRQIKRMLVERLFLDVAPEEVADDADLMATYGVDSVQLFEIVVGLEDDMGISLEEDDFDLQTFSTVEGIAGLVTRKKGNGV